LVFVQYQITTAQVERMVVKYSKAHEARGAKVVTVFPAVAWRHPDITEGAILVSPPQGDMKSLGLAEKYIVTSIRDRVIKDAATFKKVAEEEITALKDKIGGGNLKLLVKTGDSTLVEFNERVAGKMKAAPVRPRTGGSTGPRRGGDQGVNYWGNRKGPARENAWD
jgi:hypothetical protein